MASTDSGSRPWLQQIVKLVPDLRQTLWVGLACTASIECLKLTPPYLLKTAIDWLGDGATSLLNILLLVAGILLVSVFTTFVEDHYSLFALRRSFKVETELLSKAHAQLLTLGLPYHEVHPSGDLAQLVNKGAARLRELLWFALNHFLGAMLQIVLTSVVLLSVHPGCGLVFISFLPLVLFRVHHAGRKLQPYRERYHAMFREASWDMNQSLLNVRTVMDFVQERSETDKYGRMLQRYLSLADERNRIENVEHRLRDWVLGLGRFAVLLYAVYLVHSSAMTTGSLFLLATLSEKVVASLFRMGRLYSYLGDSAEAVRQLTQIFAATPNIVDRCDARRCQRLEGSIELSQVEFGYQPRRPVLSDISLGIPARSVVAIVGRSGAGKTTLIKLLSRHYDVTGGAILVDGVDIRDYAVADYRRQVAVVSQDIQLFDCSIGENIAYGRAAELTDIRRAARLANADDFIQELPEGYATRVGERGLKLSGGQRQRVGIARALLVRPAILVFDEATSSLDTESERLIQDALGKIAHQQTMILIAHRLSTIETADRVVVLDQGRIVESGSPVHLVRRNGIFARMRRLQSLGELRP